MKKQTIILALLFSAFSFSLTTLKKSERVGIANGLNQELRIEIFPSIQSSVEKYIIWDTPYIRKTGYWRFDGGIGIDAKVLKHQYGDTGIYIMKPKSFFSLGFSYDCGRNKFRKDDLDIKYLKVYSQNDTFVCRSKQEIMSLLEDPKFKYRKGDKIDKSHYRQFEHVIVIK